MDTAVFGQILLQMILLFAAALVVVRLMGNRTVGQLSPFDFVLMVGIGDIIVTASMDRNQNILAGIEGLLALLILQQLLSYLALKSIRLRKWFEGTPITLIQNGKIIRENFAKTHFNYDDLRQELHRQGMDMTNLKDIKLARLESCGSFTVVKNPNKEPLTKEDLTNFFQTIYDNPLSPAGGQLAQFEQLITDLHVIAEHIKREENGKVQFQQIDTQITKDIH